jgi:mRNA interferase RelE/StbE
LAWTIELDPAAEKQLGKLDRPVAKRVTAFLHGLGEHGNPRREGAPLKGKLAGYWKFRVGDYRVIAILKDDVLRVIVVKVGHRRDIYDR